MAGGPTSPTLSPLNPSAQRGGPSPTNSYPSSQQQPSSNNYSANGAGINNPNANGLGSRFSNYGYGNGGPGAQGGAHPLSNALYADSPSSPTLAGDIDDAISDEKKGLASFPPSSSSASSNSSNNRRILNQRNGAHHNEGGLSGAYKRWSGAFIADSGVDESHRKQERVGWLDGLRFFAAWLVINGTFFDATIGNSDVSGCMLASDNSVSSNTFLLMIAFSLIFPFRYLVFCHLPHSSFLTPPHYSFPHSLPLRETEVLCYSKKFTSIHFQIFRYWTHFLPHDSG